jgi:tripartite-type tricarboxylate transporter receptor subunit TctC
MRLYGRRVAYLIACTAALIPLSCAASAENYPTRPVQIIVGLPAGSATDTVARLVGQMLSERLAQPFIIENRPGAATNVGTEAVVRAPPDGQMLLLVTSINAINASLYEHLGFNFMRDIAPVARIGTTRFVMAINPSIPAKTVPEFIAYARRNPGKIALASSGMGSGNHVFGALFEMMAGVKLLHVPYRSSYMPDLLAGQVQLVFNPIAQSIAYIRSGQIRALAVTSSTRSETLPDTPTLAESVPGYEASGWQGIGAPRGTSDTIIERLNAEVGAVTAHPGVKKRLLDLGVEPTPMTPAEFAMFISDETEKWGKVIRAANIRPQ